MKQAIRLHIPEPCHEDWNKMTPSEQGRFCMSCQKTVVNFSLMTDKEIIDYISKASSNTCGHVRHDQMNRVIQAESDKKKYSFKYIWSVLIGSFLLSQKAGAQDRKISGDTIIQYTTEKNERMMDGFVAVKIYKPVRFITMKGLVLNKNNEPVPFANIVLKGSSKGVTADSTGAFEFKQKIKVDDAKLIASSAGYESQEVDISSAIIDVAPKDESTILDLGKIVLTEKILDEVVVYADECKRIRTTGAVVTVSSGMIIPAMQPDTIFTRVINKFQSFIGINEIKIYPNPVPAGSPFNMVFNVPAMGQYSIEFIDASGRVVLVKELNIAFKGQLQSFSSSELQTSGAYFVRVRGKKDKALYHAKLVIQ